MIRCGAYVKDSIYDSMNFATVVLRRHNCREYQLSRCGSKSTRVPSYDHCISGATLIRESNVVPVLGTLHCWSCYQHYYVSSATLHGRSYIVVTPAWLLLSAATSVVSNCMEDWMWLVWLQLLLRFVLWTLNQWYCIAWKIEPCPNEMVEIYWHLWHTTPFTERSYHMCNLFNFWRDYCYDPPGEVLHMLQWDLLTSFYGQF